MCDQDQFEKDRQEFEACGLGHICRTSTAALVVTEFGVVYLSFLSTAGWLDVRFLIEPSAPPRLAIPALAGLVVLVLRNAYVGPRRRSAFPGALDAMLGVALALVSQAVLSSIQSRLALPQVVTVVGGPASLVMLSAVRVVLSPTLHGAHAVATKVDQ